MENFKKIYQIWCGLPDQGQIMSFKKGVIDEKKTYFDLNGHRYNWVKI